MGTTDATVNTTRESINGLTLPMGSINWLREWTIVGWFGRVSDVCLHAITIMLQCNSIPLRHVYYYSARACMLFPHEQLFYLAQNYSSRVFPVPLVHPPTCLSAYLLARTRTGQSVTPNQPQTTSLLPCLPAWTFGFGGPWISTPLVEVEELFEPQKSGRL